MENVRMEKSLSAVLPTHSNKKGNCYCWHQMKARLLVKVFLIKMADEDLASEYDVVILGTGNFKALNICHLFVVK